MRIPDKVTMLSGMCELCGEQLHTFGLAHRVKEALRWEQIPVCGYSLMDCCAPFPGNPPRRFPGCPPQPLVSTREHLIALVRSVAVQTGAIPQTSLVKFIAQVPQNHIMPALSLLYNLPTPTNETSWSHKDG